MIIEVELSAVFSGIIFTVNMSEKYCYSNLLMYQLVVVHISGVV